MLAVVPGEEEQSRKNIGVVCEQFNQSAQGLELEKLSSIVPDKNDNGSNRTSPYKVFLLLLIPFFMNKIP